MAELSLPTLKMEIEADGTAAIREYAEMAEDIAQSAEEVTRSTSGAADGLSEMGSAARRAGSEIKSAGGEAENFGKQTEDAAKKAGASLSEIGEKMSKTGKTMTVALTAPIMAALTASVSGASDLTETLGKTEVVFGGMTDSVLDWSSSSVDAMGLAQETALSMASTYGDMATGMGLAQGAAAEMSMNLVQLGADLASFKNIGIDEVNTAMTAVFTGETESLKRLGIVMTQTNLEQFALTQGITKQISAMSQVEQVQLRYQYVMAMTANAQGDFARTGGNLANQGRALKETIKETANAFGALMVPAVTKVVSALRNGAQWLSELDDGTKRAVLTIGMVVAAVGPLLMVGGKVLTMVQSIQGAVALLTANPAILAIGAAVAAFGLLAAAANGSKREVDTTSDSYQDLKRVIEGGAEGKLSIDRSEIDALNDDPPRITIDADGQKALDAAKGIITSLKDEEYEGMLAIDGDPAKAKEALTQLEKDIAAVEEAVSIDGDSAEAEAAIAALEESIAAIEGMVVVTEDPTARATLEEKLSALRTELSTLKGSVTVEMSAEDERNLDALKKKLDELPRDETYKNTGEFVISGATADVIQQYADAVAAAAGATGDYAGAVDALNSIVDSETQRKSAEVYTQMAEAGRLLTAQLNDGVITQDQYDARVKKITEDGYAQIDAIEKEAEARKKLHEGFANGKRSDDYATQGQIWMSLFEDEHVTAEQGQNATRRIIAGEYNGDADQKQIDAMTTLSGLRQEAIEENRQLYDATKKYSDALAEADNIEQNGAILEDGMNVSEAMERTQLAQKALEDYIAAKEAGVSTENAIETVVDRLSADLAAYDGLEEDIRSILAGDDGSGLNGREMYGKGDELDTMLEGYKTQLNEAAETAAQKREEALTEYQNTVSALQESGYNTAETTAALKAAEAAGAAVEEADRQLIQSGTQLIDNLAEAIESGDSGRIQAAMDAVLGEVDTGPIGESAVDGVAEGMGNTDSISSAANKVGDATYKGIANSIGAHSPATRLKPIGKFANQGIAEGMKDTSSIQSATAEVGAEIIADMREALADGPQAGEELITGVADAVIAGAGNVSTRASSAMSRASSSAASTASSGGKTIGKNLMTGVETGIANQMPTTIEKVKEAAKKVIEAFKSAADINSPSRVMEKEFGMQLMAGGEVGIEKRTPATIKRIRESVSQVISGATAVINSGGFPMPAMPAAIPVTSVGIDYDRLAEVVTQRPISFSVGAKRLTEVTRDEAARQQAVRVQQINAGYGGRK